MRILGRLTTSRNDRAADLLSAPGVGSELSPRDRRFASELVHGVLRNRLAIDCVAAAYSKRPLAELDSICLEALRIGIYQLLFLDGVPPFAAVAETVKALGSEHEGIRGAVNATLRAIDRDANRMALELDRGGSSAKRRLAISDRKVVYFPRDIFCAPEESLPLYLGQQQSHPPALVERWLSRFDRATVESILAANNSRPRATGRVNTMRSDRQALLARLRSENVLAGEGTHPESVLFAAPVNEIVECQAFRDGWFYLQDETAMRVSSFASPRAGERILDLCAAPGGKATALFAQTRGEARIVANDSDATRIERLRENLARLGCGAIEVTHFDPLAPDATIPAQFEEPFDLIVVDAPCSNTGVLRRRLEARWRVDEASIHRLAAQSRELLDFASKHVAPGGRIVFSTCSIEHEENEENVQRFLVAHPAFKLARQESTLPSASGADGGYVAELVSESAR